MLDLRPYRHPADYSGIVCALAGSVGRTVADYSGRFRSAAHRLFILRDRTI
jgi:hypothetical protein